MHQAQLRSSTGDAALPASWPCQLPALMNKNLVRMRIGGTAARKSPLVISSCSKPAALLMVAVTVVAKHREFSRKCIKHSDARLHRGHWHRCVWHRQALSTQGPCVIKFRVRTVRREQGQALTAAGEQLC